jgi:hypothetical protein
MQGGVAPWRTDRVGGYDDSTKRGRTRAYPIGSQSRLLNNSRVNLVAHDTRGARNKRHTAPQFTPASECVARVAWLDRAR